MESSEPAEPRLKYGLLAPSEDHEPVKPGVKGKFIRSGKVKDIYDLDADHLLFKFSDRVSAFPR